MASIINVDQIGHSSSGNTALTIDTSGRVTMANTVQIDNWRLTGAFSTNAATITGWEQPDNTTSATAGTGMSESSGIFTFPNTGLWKVTGSVMLQLSSADAQGGVWFEVSSDSGSTYDRVAGIFESGTTHSQNQGFTNQVLINVTNASTIRFRLFSHSLDSSNVSGATDLNYTNLMFERITDSQ